MMELWRARRKGIVGPAAAVTLVTAIVWLAVEVYPLARAEVKLAQAERLIPRDPLHGFAMLEKISSLDDLSARQRERGTMLARDAFTRVCEGHHLLRMVGTRAFDPASPAKSNVTAGRDMVLTFELPPGLRDLGARVRVSDGERELCEVRFSDDGTQGLCEVPLHLGGRVVADVDLVCAVGAFGSVVKSIARSLPLAQQSRGPVVRLLSGTRIDELKDGEPVRLQVPCRTPLRVELADDLGLSDLQWTVEGVAHKPFDWSGDAGASARTADLPLELTDSPAHARTLELRASNAIGLTTLGLVELLVREPGTAPVASARIGSQEVRDESTVLVDVKSSLLSVVMTKGEFAEDLSVLWGDQPLKTFASGHEVTAQLEVEAEGPRALSVSVRGTPVIRATVRFDWTPPVVCAAVDPGNFPRELDPTKRVQEVPVGSVLKFVLTDLGGLDTGRTKWTLEGGLEEIPEPDPDSRGTEPLRSCTRLFRCVRCGNARVVVGAWDLAGNRSMIHEYLIRGADPMEGRVLTLNGRPFVHGRVTHTRETRFVVKSEGGIDLDGLVFFLLDPEQRNAPLGQATLERAEGAAGVRTGVVDVSFLATSGRRILAILSRNERELLRGEIVVDFLPPVFKLKLEEAGAGGEDLLRYFGQGGQLVPVTLSDDVGVDVTTISALGCAKIEDLETVAPETRFWLRLESVIEDPIVLRAVDLAGNQASLKFEVVVRPERVPTSRPSTRASADPPKPAARAPALAELLGTPRITHPVLGAFQLVPVKDPGVPPFYIGESEVTVREWKRFLASVQGAKAGRQEALAAEANRLLNTNLHVLKKEDDDPVASVTAELLKAYVAWANVVAPEHGAWRVPTAAQWKLAAGRAAHPDAAYPTTAAFPTGSDLTSVGTGGAFFGHDAIAAQEMPRRLHAPGAFHLRGMAGSLYEWVIDPHEQFRLIGGSAVRRKEDCRLDAPLRSLGEVEHYERGLRLVLIPSAR
jgi:Sulfatase-modifying factor enzyme 1